MKFSDMGLEESVLQGLEAMNFEEATPVQEKTIPVILEGKDIIGCAQTGTGKTAAYILPVLNRMAKEEKRMTISTPLLWHLPGNLPNRSICNLKVFPTLFPYRH